MPEPQTNCAKCGASILESTAKRNNGHCKPCTKGIGLGDVAEGMDFGMRLLLGVFFGALLAGFGFGIGSFLGTIGGIIVAIPFAGIAFVYGCFCVEINAIVRSLLPFMLDP